MFNAYLSKNRKARRQRLEARQAFDHARNPKHPHVSIKERRKFIKMNPISDAMFCDDLSYVPFRFIRGTLQLPGAEPGKGYVAQ